jgi:hypothetical protein
MSTQQSRSGFARRTRPALLSVAALSVGALAIAPGIASASTPASVHSVSSHVRSAESGVHSIVLDVKHHASSKAITKAANQVKSQTGAASTALSSLYRDASTPSGATTAAQALELFATQQGSEAQGLTGILGQVPQALQSLIAQLVSSSTTGSTLSMNLLGDLLPQLGGSSQSTGAQTIASQAGQAGGVATTLAQGLSAGNFACTVEGFISQALAASTAAIDTGTGFLTPLLSSLPSAVSGDITSFISGLPAELKQLETDLTTALAACPTPTTTTSTSTGSTGSTTTSTGSTPTLPGMGMLSGVFQMVQSMLGDLLGGQHGAGLGGLFGGLGSTTTTGTSSTGSTTSTTGASTLTNPLSGLLGELSKLVPGLGSLTSMIPSFGSGGFPF